MGFALLWIEALATVLLLAAAVVAMAGRRRRRWSQLLIAAVALPLPVYMFVTTWLALQHSGGDVSRVVIYVVSWVALANAGVLVLMVVGLRRRGQPVEPRARTWKPARLAGAGVAAALLTSLTLWTMSNALLSRVAALRAQAGTLALSAAPARLPDHENAARIYEAAAEQLRLGPGDAERLDAWLAADKFDADDPAVKAFLARRAAGLELIERATALPGCRFETAPDMTALFEGANHVRTAANLVSLQARFHAARGNTQLADTLVGQIFKMAGHVAGNPDLNSILTAAALDSRALATLDRILVAGVGKGGVSLNVELGLFRTDLRRALQMEQALVYGRLAGIAEQSTGYGLVWLDDDLGAHHALYRRLLEESAKPYPECLRGWAGVPAELARLPGIIHRLSTSAYATLLPTVARADACRRVAELAVVVAGFQIDEGRFPTRAEELVPKYMRQIPTDPFTGEPLKLKTTAEGVVVYSVGPDGVDDQGTPLTEYEPAKGDIRVRIGAKK